MAGLIADTPSDLRPYQLQMRYLLMPPSMNPCPPSILWRNWP